MPVYFLNKSFHIFYLTNYKYYSHSFLSKYIIDALMRIEKVYIKITGIEGIIMQNKIFILLIISILLHMVERRICRGPG